MIRDIAWWELGFEHERVLTTVILAQDDFDNGPMSASSLVANIRRTSGRGSTGRR